MASAVSNRLTTNYIPSDYEIKHIKSLIEEKKAIVDEIDGQIRVLVERKSAHTKFIDEHSTLISPVRRLSSDVLTSILAMLLARPMPQWHRVEEIFKEERSNQSKHPLIVCSQVCRAWRGVLLDSPSLWSVLDISTPSFPRPPHEPYHFPSECLPPQTLKYHHQEIVKWKETVDRLSRQTIVFLQRSASSPLTISFRISPIASTWLLNEVSECRSSALKLAQVLCQERRRWKEFRFLSAAAFEMIFLDSLIPTPLDPAKDLPFLETFEQRLCPKTPLPSEVLTEAQLALWESNILRSPSLRALRLEPHRHDLLTLSVNWTALTHLTLTDAFQWQQNDWSYPQLACFQITSTLNLLELSPSLKRCHIEYWYPEEDEEDSANDYEAQASTFKFTSSRTTAHPNLLSIGISGHVIPNGLASHLQLPHLRSLSICTTSAIVLAVGYNGLVEWIERFGPQLTDASFNYSNMSSETLQRCLSFLRNITSLQTRAVGMYGVAEYPEGDSYTLPALIDDDILATLTPKLNEAGKLQGGYYCPKLVKFSGYVGAGEFTEQAFVDFVASRLPVRNPTVGGGGLSTLRATEVGYLKHVEIASDVWDTSRVRGMLEDSGSDVDGCRLHLVYCPAREPDVDYLSHYENLLDENFPPI